MQVKEPLLKSEYRYRLKTNDYELPMEGHHSSITIGLAAHAENRAPCYVAVSVEMAVITVSDAFQKLTGAGGGIFSGRYLMEAFPILKHLVLPISGMSKLEEAVAAVAKHCETMVAEFVSVEIPDTLGTPSRRFWTIRVVPVLADARHLLCVYIAIEDVTVLGRCRLLLDELRHNVATLEKNEQSTLRKLMAAEQKFLKIFELCPVPLCAVANTDGRIVLANRAFETASGVRTGTCTGLSLTDVGFQADALVTGTLHGAPAKPVTFDVVLKTSAGTETRFLASADSAEVDGAACMLVAFTDLSEHKAREEDLLRSNAFLDIVLEHIPDTVFVKDASNLKFLRVNKAGEKLFAKNKEHIEGQSNFDLFDADTAEKMTKDEKQLLLTGGIKETEAPVTTEAGEKWIYTKKIPFYQDGQPKYLIGIGEDVTERIRQQEAVLALNKELEAFSYSVSHDLRAPLRAITGYARMLDEDYTDILDGEGRRILHSISDHAEKMGLLIDNLLAFSRLGRKELSKKETDMDALVRRAADEVLKATASRAKLVVQRLDSVWADPELLTRALVNLIDNAVKYSAKKPEPFIEISSKKEGGEVVFTIRDNGAGFDMRYYDKLFGVFQRLHTADEFEGNGVGLAIVQRIISKHGGNLWAESAVGAGATFRFSLPNHL